MQTFIFPNGYLISLNKLMYEISLYNVTEKIVLQFWFFFFSYGKNILWKLNMASFWDRSESLWFKLKIIQLKDKTITWFCCVVWTFVPYRYILLMLLTWIFSTEDLDVQKYFEILSFSKSTSWWFQKNISKEHVCKRECEPFDPTWMHTCLRSMVRDTAESVANMLYVLGYKVH